ncbi:MAG: SPOR domain-containing protein [Gemmatimonadetes bacterium]|nr:SPOR domain-containing protein [Gemmatimonadota bacterium]
MTGRTLTPTDLPELVPTLVASSHVIALVATTSDDHWASQAGWAFARAAASSGRRVLFVDIGIGPAHLDAGATEMASLGVEAAGSARVSTAIFAAVGLAVALALVWSRSSGMDLSRSDRRARLATARVPDPRTQESADSLYYSVQVAAHNTLPEAMVQAEQLERDGRVAIVSPALLGAQAVWYRVLIGALPTARAADSVLQELWQARLLERPQGTILRTPEAYRIRARGADVTALRGRGIPAYIVPAADGTTLVYAGAFDVAEQALMIDSLLASAHLTGTLVKRTGLPR